MITARELTALVDGRVVGDPEAVADGYAGLEAAGPVDVTFAVGDRYRSLALGSKAAIVVVADPPIEDLSATQIVVPDPNLAFAIIVDRMTKDRQRRSTGISPSADVDPGAAIDAGASIHAGAIVAKGARIGRGSVIHSGAVVGEDATIGEDCVLNPNVVVMHGVQIGNRVTIHGGAVIGADGFGYATTNDGRHVKIPQTGTVVIEDDVEIGACTCIDRARFDATRIGRGTKIDNLVQIAHNVVIGPHSMIISQVGIAGSTKLGHHVVLAGHVGVSGHLDIGDGAQVSAFSGVGNDLPGGQAYMGVPARPIREGKLIRVLEGRLPSIYQRLKELEKMVAELTGTPEVKAGEGTGSR